jgi:hypothetical protein
LQENDTFFHHLVSFSSILWKQYGYKFKKCKISPFFTKKMAACRRKWLFLHSIQNENTHDRDKSSEQEPTSTATLRHTA